MIKGIEEEDFETMLQNDAVVQWQETNGAQGHPNKLKKITDPDDLKVRLGQMTDEQQEELKLLI